MEGAEIGGWDQAQAQCGWLTEKRSSRGVPDLNISLTRASSRNIFWDFFTENFQG